MPDWTVPDCTVPEAVADVATLLDQALTLVAGTVVKVAALACRPREATRPLDTAMTAPALATGLATPDR